MDLGSALAVQKNYVTLCIDASRPQIEGLLLTEPDSKRKRLPWYWSPWLKEAKSYNQKKRAFLTAVCAILLSYHTLKAHNLQYGRTKTGQDEFKMLWTAQESWHEAASSLSQLEIESSQ